MELRQLRYFVRVVELGSISRAALDLQLVQSALSQPTSVVIHGMDKMEYLEHGLNVVKNFKRLTPQQVEALGAKAKNAALAGGYELYKTTNHFDSTAQHPDWLG